jgi:membrane-associated phospholipid phosphatase
MLVHPSDISAGPSTDTRSRAGRNPLLRLAGAGALAFAAFTALVFLAPPVQSVDRAGLQGFQIGLNSREPANVHHVAHSSKALPVVALLALLAAVALVRRRPERAVAAVTLVVGAGALTQLLKTALATQREVAAAATYSVHAASYPSGHATASMSLVLAAVIVMPRRLVPLAAVAGCVWSLAVSFAMLVLHRHFPSDLIAGYLVAATWGLVVLAGLRSVAPGGEAIRPPMRVAAGSGIAMLVFGLVAFAAGDASHTVDQRAAAALVATALVALAGLIVGLWALQQREDGSYSKDDDRDHDHPHQQQDEPDAHSPPLVGSRRSFSNAPKRPRLTETVRSPDPPPSAP